MDCRDPPRNPYHAGRAIRHAERLNVEGERKELHGGDWGGGNRGEQGSQGGAKTVYTRNTNNAP